MSGVKTRLPREVFTKKLVRICERLDEAHERVVSHKDFFGEPTTARISVASLWVVGSYARGAAHCGDLDVVLQVRSLKGMQPRSTQIRRAFFGALHDVSCYTGVPSENSSGADFPDRVRIWNGPGCNWRAAIASISLDPAAGRAPRETDSIPFTPQQLNCRIETLQRIASLRDQGVLEWEFTPVAMSEPEGERASAGENSKTSIFGYADFVGKKSRQLFPAIDRLMKIQEPFGQWSMPDFGTKSILRCGGTLVCLGTPPVPGDLLENSLAVRQLLVVPHLSRRNPNGMWLIRRGPSHPDVAKLAGIHAFHHVQDGRPMVVTEFADANASWTSGTQVIELYRSRHEAESWAEELNQDCGPQVKVKRIEGVDLPQLTGLCEVVEVDGALLPTEFTGRRLAGRETDGTIAELADLLRSR